MSRMGNVPLLSKGYVTQRDGIVCVYHNFCLFFKDLLAVWILSDEVDIDTGQSRQEETTGKLGSSLSPEVV